MGLMTKMRENTKYVLYFLVLAFGILFMLQDAGTFDFIGSQAVNNIIVVDGEPVTYEQYRNILDYQIQQFQAQTGESMSQQALDNARDVIYNQLVDGMLIEHEMDRLGITVTDDELVDLVLGDDPHPMVVRTFQDAQGGLDRTLLQSFLDDPTASQQWAMLEEQLRDTRRREKLQNLMEATVRVSDEDVMTEYRRRNLKVDTRFVALRYAIVRDDSIDFSESDLRSYYNEHREDFSREKSYTLDYVSIPKVPSAQDTVALFEEMEQLKQRFAETDNDSLFLARYASARPYASTYFLADDLDPEMAVEIFQDLTPGRIVGPTVAGNEIRLVKIQEVAPSGETLVRARHILFRFSPNDDADKQQKRQEALDVKRRIENGEDFANLARLFSSDNANAAQGGELGWFGRGRMAEPFENAAYAARVGQIVGPIETQFGYHLIEVTDRTDREVRLADYAQIIEPSVSTLNGIAERLGDLEYYASESGDFSGEAGRLGLNLQQVQVQAGQSYIPGIGNSRQLRNFMEASSEGNVSTVIELDDMFVVAQLSQIQPEGYRSFEEVKAEIEPRAKLEKKKEYQLARMEKAFAATGYDGLAGALGVTERVVPGVSFDTRSITELGNDPIFKGTVLSMKADQTSGIIEGANAVYVVRVTNVTEPGPITDAEKSQLRTQLTNQLKTQVTNQWLVALREKADITDNRRFFAQ